MTKIYNYSFEERMAATKRDILTTAANDGNEYDVDAWVHIIKMNASFALRNALYSIVAERGRNDYNFTATSKTRRAIEGY